MYAGIAFQVADCEKLSDWLKLYRNGSGEIASRLQVVANGHVRTEGVRVRVIAELRKSKGVTVGLDGWTNVKARKVVNVVPYAGGVAYYWQSLVLQGFSKATDQIDLVAASLQSLIDKSILVVAMVTDNESVNGLLHRMLLPRYPFLLLIPCAAHVIQLCVVHIMKTSFICNTVNGLLALLVAYKKSKELRIGLREQQLLLRRGKEPLNIIKANDTRWNSLLYAAQRVLLLSSCIRPFISLVISTLADEKKKKKRDKYARFDFSDSTFWNPLEQLVAILQPFQRATDVVQTDSASLSDIHLEFARLMQLADKLTAPHPLARIRRDLMEEIKLQWDTHVNKNAVICCARFSFDKSYDSFPPDEQSEAQAWFFEWGKQYLLFYKLTTVAEDDISAVLLQQFGDFNLRRGGFSTMDAHHDTLKTHHDKKMEKEYERKRCRYDARQTWSISMSTAKELTILVVALLSITASEAAVERTFSRQGLIHSKLRNRMKDSTVQMQMFFSFNSRALDKTSCHNSASWEELTVEDARQGTELLSSYRPKFNEEILDDSDDDEDYTGEPCDSEEEEEEEVEVEVDQEEQQDAEAEQERERMEGKYNGPEGEQEGREVRAAEEVKQEESKPEKEEAQVEAEEEEGEEEEEDEEDPKKKKEREKRERVAALAAFAKEYVEQNNIGRGYVFGESKRTHLSTALIEADIGDTEEAALKVIRKLLKDRPAAAAAAAEPVAADVAVRSVPAE